MADSPVPPPTIPLPPVPPAPPLAPTVGDPIPVPPTPRFPRLHTAGVWLAFLASVAAVLVPLFTGTAPPVPPVIPDVPLQPQPASIPPPKFPFGMGWANDPQAVAESKARSPVVEFATTPAGKAVMAADAEQFLWRSVRKAAGKKEVEAWYPNVNQQQVGCCVGCGWKHSTDVCAAVQIVTGGRNEEFKPVAVEVIYAGSRVDVGGGKLSGDGSLGAWANEWVKSKGGVVPMAKYSSADLTAFSPARARQWGSQGIPADIKAAAREHPVKGTAQVSSWEDVQRAIAQGYPVAVCSNQGFAGPDGQSPGTRDKDGFCAARGTWPHCMCFIGIRDGARPGAFCLNSWGDDAHRGPTYPADAPPAGFWVDAKTVDSMVRQGDSFALADLQGFPARNLDWLFGRANDPAKLLAGLFPVTR